MASAIRQRFVGDMIRRWMAVEAFVTEVNVVNRGPNDVWYLCMKKKDA
jgi:hypothetical protein